MALMQPQSDVGVLWEAALDNYRNTADVDLRACLRTQRNAMSIKIEQQRQLENFKVFRHDKGKLDRFRTMISGNADIIEGAAKHIGNAASIAFPPSSAILTAFTLVMTSSKYVTDDYDMIESFFSIMQSFLQRLRLLENKIQPRSFQSFLINVFSSLLQLSAIARAYCAKGRFSKWARALVDGNDPGLKAAYEKLNTDLQDLESAIIMQTLRTTIEISEDAKSTNRDVKALQVEFGLNTSMTKQTLETSAQTLMIAMRTEEMIHTSRENTTTSNELLRNLEKKLDRLQTKDKEDKQRNMKSGASRPVNFERLRLDHLKNHAEGGVAERLTDIKFSFVDRLFDWIEAEPAMESIANVEESLLWVNAAPGMGKSTLSFRMLQYLEGKYYYDPSVCVAWFPFDEEHPEMRSVSNMLKCCSIRVAERDARYCKETLITLQQGADLATIEDAWHHLIESRYSKESGRRLILILDGIDEVDEEDAPELMEILARIKSEGYRVQVIFTCSPDKKQDWSILGAKCIDLTRDKILQDMYRFTWSKTKTLARLRKLRLPVRKTIVRKVMKKADSFLYIDHTMRRLNTLGREGPISKELESLADNTEAIYHNLLEECQRNRTPEDRELLRSLLAWLAYTKSKVTIGQANLLVEIITKEHAISIEEELDGRLSRLLRISGDRSVNEQDDSSENDEQFEAMGEDDTTIEGRAEDADNFLSFQERSLKAYFRHAIQDRASALQCTATEAHAIIFKTCSAILTFPKKSVTPARLGLVEYASEWGLSHLLEIQPDDPGSVSDELAKIILESIYNIYTNKNDSLKPLEVQAVQMDRTLLSGNGFTQLDVLTMLSAWAKRARSLPPNQLPYGILDWFRPLEQEPLRIFIGLSRAHITNWFAATHWADAHYSFTSAHSALREGRNLPELRQNPSLEAYFEDFLAGDQAVTERSFETVANCFWDIVKTSSSYKGIGMAMMCNYMFEPAIKQLNKGLEDGTIDQLEKFLLLTSKGEALMKLGQEQTDEEKKRQYLEQSLNALNDANELYRVMTQATQNLDQLRTASPDNFRNTAQAAALLGKSELVLSSIKEGKAFNPKSSLFSMTQIFPALKKADQLPIIIELLKFATKWDITWYLTMEDAEEAQEAAATLGQGQLMLDTYSTAQKAIDAWPFDAEDSKARLQLNAAAFARRVLGDLDMSKSMLRELINHPKTPSWGVIAGCNRLTEILLENFRLSKDPRVKKNALNEAINVLHKPAEVMPDIYKPAETHMMASVGYMLRHLGPALDYFDYMNAAFRNCIEELQDDSGANDLTALRRLAHVLSYVSVFEREASIALTAQLYVIDEDVHRKDVEQGQVLEEDRTQVSSAEGQEIANGTKLQESTEVEQDGPSVVQSLDAIVDGNVDLHAPKGDVPNGITNTIETPALPDDTDKSSTTDKIPITTINEMDIGLLNTVISCNMCNRDIDRWSAGAVYFCIYCIDVDICESCFAKKTAQESGELLPDWRVICPKGHRHIKTPVEGWRGIKDGIMRIGAEEIPFQTWLGRLEVAWAKYWDEFWMVKD